MMMQPQQQHLLEMNAMSGQSGPPPPAYLGGGPKSPGPPPPPPPPPGNWGLHLSDHLEKAYTHPFGSGLHFSGGVHHPGEEGEYPPPPPPPPAEEAPLPGSNTSSSASSNSSAASSNSSSASKKSQSRRNAWGNLSYADLITQAINSAPEKRLTLSQVYEWMVQNIPYFKDKGDSNSSAGWKNSIRHNLSLHNRFVRVQNEGTGKSSWWMINPDAKHSGGKSSRRRASSALVDGKPVGENTKRRGRKQKPGFVTDLIAATARNSSAASSPSPNVELYGGGPNGPPESPGYQYSPFSNISATDLRTGRSDYGPNDMSSPPVRHEAPYPTYNDWSPEYSAATVQGGGYFGNTLNRGNYCEEPRALSPLRNNGFPYREGFSNGANDNFSIKNFFDKDTQQQSSPHHLHSLNQDSGNGVPHNYSNLQVMSPVDHPPSSPGVVVNNSRHQFPSDIPPPPPPPSEGTLAYYPQPPPPTHASPESPAGAVRAPSTGSSSTTGSILERALASSVKSEGGGKPGSPPPHHPIHNMEPGHDWQQAQQNQQAHFGEDFMKHEYGGHEYPGGYPQTPDGESPNSSPAVGGTNVVPGGPSSTSSSQYQTPVPINPSWVR